MTCKNPNTVWVVDAVRPTMEHYRGFSMFLEKCSTHSVIDINPALKYTFSLSSKSKYFMIVVSFFYQGCVCYRLEVVW